MDNEVNSWIHYSRSSDEYAKGVEDYLNYAFLTRAQGDQISCPCKDCYNRYWYRRDEVYNHMIANGIGRGIIEWHFKKGTSSSKPGTLKDIAHDDMEGLVFDTHRETRKRTSGIKYKTPEVDTLQNKDNELLGRCGKRVKTPSKSGIIIPDEFLQSYRDEIVKDTIAGVLKIFKQHLPSEVLGPIASSFENRKGVPEFATTPTNGESSRTINYQVDEDSDGESNNDGDGIDESRQN